jgi:hypothetical protein
MADFNLFGDPSAYQGLLNEQQIGNAQNQGLLSAAAALLQAGGPSLQKRSLGQALGAGFLAGQQGYNNALEQGVKGQLAAIQLQNAKRNLTINNAIMGNLMPGAAGLNGQAPTAATGTTAAAPSLAPTGTGAAGGDSTATQAAQPAAATAPAQAAAPAVNVANEFQIPGMSGTQSLAMFVNAPEKYWEAMAKANELPQFARDMKAAGIDPNSPLGKSLASQYVQKQLYMAPTSLRPGGGVYDPHSGQITMLPSAAPEGFQNVKQPDGSWAVVPIAGGTAAITASTQAATTGREAGSIKTGVDEKGNPVYTTGAQIMGNGPAPLRNNNPGAMMPGGKLAQYPDFQTGVAAMDQNLARYGKQGINTLAGVISKWAPPNENDTQAYIKDVSQRLGIKPDQQIDLSNPAQRHALGAAIMLHENGPSGVFTAPQQPMVRPDMSATQKALIKQGQDYYDSAVKDGGNVNLHRQMLSEIQRLAADPNAKFGPGTPEVAKLKALANNLGIDMTSAQTAQDVMNKLSSQLVMSQLGVGGTGTDAQLNTLLHGNPNGEMTNQAILKVVPLLAQQLDLKEARANILNNEVNKSKSTENVPNLINQFNRLATPQIVQLGRQLANASAAGTLQDFMGKLTPQQKALLPRVQQLDQMGAF